MKPKKDLTSFISKTYHVAIAIVLLAFPALSMTGSFSDEVPQRKRLRLEEKLASPPYSRQVFGVSTYDPTFKHIMSDADVRLSFLNTFIPSVNVVESERLTEHLRPLVSNTNVDRVLNKKKYKDFMREAEAGEFRVVNGAGESHDDGTAFLTEVAEVYGDILREFPDPDRNSQLDLICLAENNDKEEYFLAELQVIPQDYWDRRALAYAASVFGNQLKAGGKWKDLKKVMAINILGGGKNNETWWKGSQNYKRHYRFQEQLEGQPRYMDGIEIIQYSINIANMDTIQDTALKEWLEYFREAHLKTRDDIQNIQTEGVKKAYELSRLEHMPRGVLRDYKNMEEIFERYEEHTQKKVEEGRQEAEAKAKAEKLESAQKFLALGLSQEDVAESLNLSLEEVSELSRNR